MAEYKVVHFHLFDPHKSLFKSGKGDKAKVFIVECGSDSCELLQRGECAYLRILGWHGCPYGRYKEIEGYTKRALKYTSWVKEQRETYKGCGCLDSHSDVMAVVGDYVFLPYAHMTSNGDIPFLAQGGALRKDNCFLKREDFTVENILNMLAFKPQAMMGGEITEYQEKSVPKFLKHLSEQMPDVFKKVCEKSEAAREKFKQHSNVGRKALLRTLTPNVGKFTDCHDAEWVWDGTWLTSTNSHASFMLVSKFSEIRIKPAVNVEVVIADENQVNKNTVFVN